jgi:hypothetical protein
MTRVGWFCAFLKLRQILEVASKWLSSSFRIRQPAITTDSFGRSEQKQGDEDAGAQDCCATLRLTAPRCNFLGKKLLTEFLACTKRLENCPSFCSFILMHPGRRIPIWGHPQAHICSILLSGVLVCSAQTNNYLFTGSKTNITLNSGHYQITAYGARGANGGASSDSVGGLGAEMSAEFSFSGLTTLTLLVGGDSSFFYVLPH